MGRRASLPIAIELILLTLVVSPGAYAQAQGLSLRDWTFAESRPWGQSVRVTDARLADALELLAAASLTADRALKDLRGSRLPVTIGTPAQLAELSEREGGPSAEERTRLMAAAATPRPSDQSRAIAWVMFRSEQNEADDRWDGWIARVWLAIEADSVESWIRQAGGSAIEQRIQHDYLAILAHEFVAHIGSIAESRQMDDLCDDPTPEQRARSAAALSQGEPEPEDGDAAACAIRVENQVREELNGVLTLRGLPPLPARNSYSLDGLNFERARRRLFPTPAQRLRPLIPIRN